MEIAKRLLLAVASLALFLGVAEALSRLAYSPRESQRASLFEPDPEKIFRLKRSHRGEFADREVTTNARGWRGPEIALAKPPDGVRVLVLGDSVSFGHGVRDDEAWPRLLQGRLAEARRDRTVEVMNTAAPGNNSYQQYFDLERSLAFDPDAVLLQFTLNDVVEPWQISRRHGPRGADYHGIDNLAFRLSRASAFYLLVRDVMTKVALGDFTTDGLQRSAIGEEIYTVKSLIVEPDHPDIRAAWDEYLEWLSKCVELARDHGLDVVLVASPFAFQLTQEPALARPQQILAAWASERDLDFVDLLGPLQGDLLQASGRPRLAGRPGARGRAIAALRRDDPDAFEAFWSRHFLDHSHYSAGGHAFVAEQLEPVVERVLSRRRAAR